MIPIPPSPPRVPPSVPPRIPPPARRRLVPLGVKRTFWIITLFAIFLIIGGCINSCCNRNKGATSLETAASTNIVTTTSSTNSVVSTKVLAQNPGTTALISSANTTTVSATTNIETSRTSVQNPAREGVAPISITATATAAPMPTNPLTPVMIVNNGDGDIKVGDIKIGDIRISSFASVKAPQAPQPQTVYVYVTNTVERATEKSIENSHDGPKRHADYRQSGVIQNPDCSIDVHITTDWSETFYLKDPNIQDSAFNFDILEPDMRYDVMVNGHVPYYNQVKGRQLSISGPVQCLQWRVSQCSPRQYATMRGFVTPIRH